MKRLEAGLFTLQLVDYIMMEISSIGAATVGIIELLFGLVEAVFVAPRSEELGIAT